MRNKSEKPLAKNILPLSPLFLFQFCILVESTTISTHANEIKFHDILTLLRFVAPCATRYSER